MKYIIIIVAVAAAAWLLSSCLQREEMPSFEENLKKGQDYMAENGQREGVITTMSGLQYEVLREGNPTGKQPTATDRVKCQYEGRFIDGTVFDSSYNNGGPIVFGLNQVIRGWTEGLQYMTEGAKFRFVIPYHLGYGASGYATIPPYSTLIFEVELIEVL